MARVVRRPVERGNSKWVYRHSCQDCCPWNVRFSSAPPDESPYAAREALGGKDAGQLARDLIGMTQEEFSRTFSRSWMKRAKLRGLTRNAAVVLANVGTTDDADVPARARGSPAARARARRVRAAEDGSDCADRGRRIAREATPRRRPRRTPAHDDVTRRAKPAGPTPSAGRRTRAWWPDSWRTGSGNAPRLDTRRMEPCHRCRGPEWRSRGARMHSCAMGASSQGGG